MKIIVENDTVQVKSLFNEFSFTCDDINSIQVMYDRRFNIIDKIYDLLFSEQRIPKLRFIIVCLLESEFTADKYDQGFNEFVDWLILNGFDMTAAEKLGTQFPFIRIDVDQK